MKTDNKHFEVSSLSDVGRKRENNEDSFLELVIGGKNGNPAHLLAVADGMGGHQGGEIASRRVVEVLKEYTMSSPIEDNKIPGLLKAAITEANRSVYEMAVQTPELKGMGSTCTVFLLIHGRAYTAHIGDSRAYLVRKSKVRRLTKDHTVLGRMLETGIIKSGDASVGLNRNLLMRAVGVNAQVEVDLVPPIHLVPGDTLVLCSDGLTEFVEEEEIGQIVSLYPPARACEVLVNMANNRGGADNITIQIAKVSGNTKVMSQVLSTVKGLLTGVT